MPDALSDFSTPVESTHASLQLLASMAPNEKPTLGQLGQVALQLAGKLNIEIHREELRSSQALEHWFDAHWEEISPSVSPVLFVNAPYS
jgi:hypothetical protein